MAELSAVDFAEATRVLQAFMEAGMRHDEAAMSACVTRRTLESGQLDASSGPEGMRMVLDDQRQEGERVVIRARAYPVDAPEDAAPAMELCCLMAREDGQWKFDLPGSLELMMGGSLEAAVEQMATALSEAVAGVDQALAAGFGQAFGDDGTESPGQDPNWDEASLTPAAGEFRPLGPLTTLPRTQAALSEAVGSPVLMQAMMPELLRQTGSDEMEVLTDWFEEQLFAGWAAMLTAVSQQGITLRNRLRAVRIEAVSQVESRLLAIDGSDLVYRMRLPYNEGFFQDDEVWAMLPGVLAGLPETIAEPVGRLLPTEDECPEAELYRRQVAPRLMRRISEAAGRPVALDADWDELGEASQSGRALWLWGLQRILGGVTLAGLEPAGGESPAAGLARVRIVLNYEVSQRYARFEDGTLEVGLNFYGGDHTGPYEHEIARALAGEAVE